MYDVGIAGRIGITRGRREPQSVYTCEYTDRRCNDTSYVRVMRLISTDGSRCDTLRQPLIIIREREREGGEVVRVAQINY